MLKNLEKNIAEKGTYLPGGILKVDRFINHQIDPQLMMEVGNELARLFAGCGATKIVTAESSGIAPAMMTGLAMHLPVVFAKKSKPSTMRECYATTVHSFTRAKNYDLIISTEMLGKDDKVLLIDDFLANGNTTIAVAELCHQAGATLIAAGYIIEKTFLKGRLNVISQCPGIHVESLATVESYEVNDDDKRFMQMAIDASVENVRNGGGPFGAVIVKDGALVATGVNRVTANSDPTAHAEVSAIRNACQKLGTFKLTGCVIYTSCEPCPMCLSAIYWSGIEKIYYGNTAIDAKGIDFDDQYIYDEISRAALDRSIPSICLLRNEAQRAFREWRLKVDKVEY